MYVHSILHHWACILISNGSPHRVWLLVRVCTWAFWDPIFFVFTLSYLFESEMSSLLLGAMGHCPFHHYIHCWCDFTPCLIWVDHHFSLYIHCFTIILVIACDSSHSLHPLILFLHWPIPSLIFPLHHSCTSHYQFDLLHCLIINIIFTLGTLSSMAHEFFYTCCILHMHGFFIIGYLSLVSLHFYYLITLVHITSRVLRPPWGHEINCRLWQPLLGQVFEI